MQPPTSFERLLRRPEKVIERQQRARTLQRILEFARVSIDDVVNDPRAKIAVRRWYRVATECEYESLRTFLERHIAMTWFARENR